VVVGERRGLQPGVTYEGHRMSEKDDGIPISGRERCEAGDVGKEGHMTWLAQH
jgi:hypothetical protein